MSAPTPRKPSGFSRYVFGVSTFFGYASAILLLAAMLIITYAALLRYIFGSSTVWQTELSLYFLLFATFCGAAYGLQHGDHVRIDIVTMRLSPRWQRVLRIVAAIFALILAIVIAVMAYGEWWDTTEAGRRSGTAWNPPLTFPHLIVPVGMTLLALQYLALIVELVRHREPA